MSAARPMLRGPVAVVLMCVAALVLEAAADVLPDTPYFTVVTWQRLVVVVGLVAVVAAGARPADFRTRLDLPIGALLFAALVAAVRGGGGPEFRHLVSFVAVYYLLVALVRIERPAWRTVAMLASGAVTVAGAVALSQVSQDTPTGFCRSGLLRDAPCVPDALVRATGTFANPNLLAAFLLLFAPLSVLAVATIADRMYQVCALALTVVGYAALLATFSRAAYVAGFAGLLVLAWQRVRPRLNPGQIRVAGWLGVGALAVAVGGIAAVSQAGRSLGVRNEAWGAAVDIARENPLGIGLGRAGAAVNARIDGTVEFVHVHNLWLNWLVEAGVLGLVAIAAVTLGALVTAVELARRDSPIGYAGLAALVGFLTMNLMDHPSNLSRIAVGFWLVLGVVMGSTPARRKIGSVEQPTEEIPRVPAGRHRHVRRPG